MATHALPIVQAPAEHPRMGALLGELLLRGFAIGLASAAVIVFVVLTVRLFG